MEFFNQLGKNQQPKAGNSSPGASSSSSPAAAAAIADRITVKEEPLSEEDMRAIQKDRQKKDNHNMSEFSISFSFSNLIFGLFFSRATAAIQHQRSNQRVRDFVAETARSVLRRCPRCSTKQRLHSLRPQSTTIRKLKNDQARKKGVEEKMRATEAQNRKLLLKLQVKILTRYLSRIIFIFFHICYSSNHMELIS